MHETEGPSPANEAWLELADCYIQCSLYTKYNQEKNNCSAEFHKYFYVNLLQVAKKHALHKS